MVLLDTGTSGTSREIYSEDADGNPGVASSFAEKNSHSKASVRAAILTESIYISYIHQKHSRKIWQILLQTQLISA